MMIHIKNDRATAAFLSGDWPDPKLAPLDVALLAGEIKIKCMLGMLMCPGTKQRMVFILGSILGVNSRIGGYILGMRVLALITDAPQVLRILPHLINTATAPPGLDDASLVS